MRTTLDIDDDVLQAAKDLAAATGVTAGRMVSDLLRKALAPTTRGAQVRNGVPLLPRRRGAKLMTMRDVNELRDADA